MLCICINYVCYEKRLTMSLMWGFIYKNIQNILYRNAVTK